MLNPQFHEKNIPYTTPGRNFFRFTVLGCSAPPSRGLHAVTYESQKNSGQTLKCDQRYTFSAQSTNAYGTAKYPGPQEGHQTLNPPSSSWRKREKNRKTAHSCSRCKNIRVPVCMQAFRFQLKKMARATGRLCVVGSIQMYVEPPQSLGYRMHTTFSLSA